MKIIRFQSGDRIHFGQPIDDHSAYRIDGPLFGPHQLAKDILPIDKLLAPIIPLDILCIGLNYTEHAKETDSSLPKHPLLFIKSSNTLNNPGDPILIPKRSNQIDYEGELAVVIGKVAKDVTHENALDYVFGYTLANDVTARDWQRDKSLGGGQFARGKSFDTFCPLGPAIITKDQIPDPSALRIRTTLNSQTVQEAPTSDMIFDVPRLIESLSSTMTLRPGTLILTGTPPGVGMARTPPLWLKSGDIITVEIKEIGKLQNPVSHG